MDYYKLYNNLTTEYPEYIALSVVQVCTINMTLKPCTNFENKIIKKSKKVLWELSEKDFNLVVNLWKVSYDWQCRQTLQGLGGCKVKTFKQLLES